MYIVGTNRTDRVELWVFEAA